MKNNLTTCADEIREQAFERLTRTARNRSRKLVPPVIVFGRYASEQRESGKLIEFFRPEQSQCRIVGREDGAVQCDTHQNSRLFFDEPLKVGGLVRLRCLRVVHGCLVVHRTACGVRARTAPDSARVARRVKLRPSSDLTICGAADSEKECANPAPASRIMLLVPLTTTARSRALVGGDVADQSRIGVPRHLLDA